MLFAMLVYTFHFNWFFKGFLDMENHFKILGRILRWIQMEIWKCFRMSEHFWKDSWQILGDSNDSLYGWWIHMQMLMGLGCLEKVSGLAWIGLKWLIWWMNQPLKCTEWVMKNIIDCSRRISRCAVQLLVKISRVSAPSIPVHRFILKSTTQVLQQLPTCLFFFRLLRTLWDSSWIHPPPNVIYLNYEESAIVVEFRMPLSPRERQNIGLLATWLSNSHRLGEQCTEGIKIERQHSNNAVLIRTKAFTSTKFNLNQSHGKPHFSTMWTSPKQPY